MRLDEEQDLTFIEPDEKKKIKRLETFVNDFHEVLLEVDFRQIFAHYQTIVQVKANSVHKVTQELMKLGILNQPGENPDDHKFGQQG